MLIKQITTEKAPKSLTQEPLMTCCSDTTGGSPLRILLISLLPTPSIPSTKNPTLPSLTKMLFHYRKHGKSFLRWAGCSSEGLLDWRAPIRPEVSTDNDERRKFSRRASDCAVHQSAVSPLLGLAASLSFWFSNPATG